MKNARFDVVSRNGRDRLGEGPVWLERRNELAWVDILAPAVHRLDLISGTITSLAVDEPIGWVLPRARAESVVAGFKSGITFLDLANGACETFVRPETERPDNRLNDAKIDRAGRIWTGSKDDTDRTASGALYRLDADRSCTRMDDGYQVTNGPTFSLDGHTLYHTDSGARTVFAFDLHDDGVIANKRVWLEFEPAWGYPDGMTTDAENCLWIAHWGGGALSRFDSAGRRIETIALPATNITSCAFAGDDLQRLFVTSSTIGCESERLAGALFEVDPGVRGLAPGAFAG